MTNIMQMLKQAQDVQAKMTAMQEKLEQVEVTGQAGNGAVQITMSAKGRPLRVQIAPNLLDPNDPGMLEDTVLAALRDYKTKADAIADSEGEKAMGGLKLPAGFKLPF
jgi:nucleoid-associated protein EbfC